jgi:hypothetical protein
MNPVSKQWTTARGVVTSDDTLISDFSPAQYDATMAFDVNEAPAVLLRGFGYESGASDNKTATMVISGWMDSGATGGVGVGQPLWRGTITLGGTSAAGVPTADNQWDDSNDWNEVDTWDSAVTNGHNSCGAIVIGERGVDEQSALLLPTLGYSKLMVEYTDLTGATEMDEVGLVYRPISDAQLNAFRSNHPLKAEEATVTVDVTGTQKALSTTSLIAKAVTITCTVVTTGIWIGGDGVGQTGPGVPLKAVDEAYTIDRTVDLATIFINGTANDAVSIFYLTD